MKVLALADIHGKQSSLRAILQQVSDIDLILVAGDITDFGSPQDAAEIIDILLRATPQVLAVAGNCDSKDIDHELSRLHVTAHGSGNKVEGLAIYGVSGIARRKGTMHELSEQEMEEALTIGYQQIKGLRPQWVLSHTPPLATRIDRTSLGTNIGSLTLRQFVDHYQPDLLVCGHVHEARGTETIGKTLVINCGTAARGQYTLIEYDSRGTKVDLLPA